MKIGAVISGLVVATGLSVGGYTFLTAASPYLTVEEALARPGQSVHVVGVVDQKSIKNDVMSGTMQFKMSDESGKTMDVVYHGPKPASFESAPKVSVAGEFKDGVFVSDKILVKCPSKYEGEKKA